MYPSKQPLSLHLLINLLILCNTTTAASILRRNPSTLINTRHPHANPEPQPQLSPKADVNPPGRLTISGHGVVAIPIPPTGERVHIDINSSPTNENQHQHQNQNQHSNVGGSGPNADSEYIKLVKVGDTTFQIIGTELTITDDRADPSPQPGGGAVTVSDGASANGREGGLGDQKLTPGQVAAMEFAKTAEAMAAGKDRVLGGARRPVGNEIGLGQAQDHEQPLGIGRRRRQIQR